MKTLKRWLAVFRAARAVLAKMDHKTPVSIGFRGFDFKQDGMLYDLMLNPDFVAMIQSLANEETGKQVEYMRACVRSGNQVEAAQAEAAATVFEDLLQVLRRYASAYTPSEPKAA